MSDTSRLNILLTADDAASAKIKALQIEIKALEQAVTTTATRLANSSEASRASLQRILEPIQAQLTARLQEIEQIQAQRDLQRTARAIAMDRPSLAAAEGMAAAIARGKTEEEALAEGAREAALALERQAVAARAVAMAMKEAALAGGTEAEIARAGAVAGPVAIRESRRATTTEAVHREAEDEQRNRLLVEQAQARSPAGVIAAASPERAAAAAIARGQAQGLPAAEVAAVTAEAYKEALVRQAIATQSVVEAMQIARDAGLAEAAVEEIGSQTAIRSFREQERVRGPAAVRRNAEEENRERQRIEQAQARSAEGIIGAASPTQARANAITAALAAGRSEEEAFASAELAATEAVRRQEVATQAVAQARRIAADAGLSEAEIEATAARTAALSLRQQERISGPEGTRLSAEEENRRRSQEIADARAAATYEETDRRLAERTRARSAEGIIAAASPQRAAADAIAQALGAGQSEQEAFAASTRAATEALRRQEVAAQAVAEARRLARDAGLGQQEIEAAASRAATLTLRQQERVGSPAAQRADAEEANRRLNAENRARAQSAAGLIAAASPSKAAAEALGEALASGRSQEEALAAAANATAIALERQAIAARAVAEAIKLAKDAGLSEEATAAAAAAAARTSLRQSANLGSLDAARRNAEAENQNIDLIQRRARIEANATNALIDDKYKAQRAQAEIDNRLINDAQKARTRSAAGIIEAHRPSVAAAEAATLATVKGASPAEAQAAGARAAAQALEQQQVAIRAVAEAYRAAAAAGADEATMAAAGARAAALALETQAAATRNVSGAAGILTREMRHVVGFFDAIARGQFGQAISSVGAGLRDAGTSAVILGTSIGGLVAFMGAHALLRGAENMGRWATETQAAAAAAGMGLEQYSALQGALTLSGLKANEADASLRRLSSNLSTAVANPASKVAEAFHNIGISQEELAAKGDNVDAMLHALADAFARTADGANKAAAFEEIFGRGWEKIIPLLQNGGASLDAAKEKVRDLGGVLTEEGAASLEATGKSVEELTNQIRFGAIQAYEDWGPAIQIIANLLGGLVTVIGTVIGAIGRMTGAIIHSIKSVSDESSQALADVTKGQDVSFAIGPDGTPFLLPAPNKGAAERRAMAPAPDAASAGMRMREHEDAAKIQVPPLSTTSGQETALGAMRDRIAKQQEAATRNMTNNMQMEAKASQVAIQEMQNTLKTANLTTKERETLETELANKTMQLRREQNSIAAAGERAGAKAAKQSYEDFAAGERLKVTEAQGSISKITAIYDEWLSAAEGRYKQNANVILTIERQKVAAINAARLQEVQESQRIEGLVLRAQKAEAAAGRVTQTPQQQVASLQAEAQALDQSAQKRIDELQTIIDTSQQGSDIQKKAAEEILQIVTSTKEQEVSLYKSAESEFQKSLSTLDGVFNTIGTGFNTMADSIFKSLVAPQKTIYKVGLSSVTENMRGQEIQQAVGKFLLQIGDSILKSVEDVFSKLAAQVAAKVLDVPMNIAEKGLGNVLSAKLSGVLGFAGKAPEQISFTGATGGVNAFTAALARATEVLTGHSSATAANTATTSGNTGATAVNTVSTGTNSGVTTTNTGATVLNTGATTTNTGVTTSGTSVLGILTGANTANSLATAENTLATIANSGAESASAGGSAIGGVVKAVGAVAAVAAFEQGGIVPSAQGGMVVGGMGGTLAILHEREMVLPSHISQGIQGMIQGGGMGGARGNTSYNSSNANMTYSPTINAGGRGRGGTGMSRAEFSEVLAMHGGILLGEARNMMRNGWRAQGVS